MARSSVFVCVCVRVMRSMRRNAFIEKNNMLLLLLLFVLLLLLLQSKKNITRYICLFALFTPAVRVALHHKSYRLHAYYAQTQWAKFCAHQSELAKRATITPICPLCSHLAAASSAARTQGYCQAPGSVWKMRCCINKFCAGCMSAGKEFGAGNAASPPAAIR